jgi:uncharacterized protein YbjT (DUF2867 family)
MTAGGTATARQKNVVIIGASGMVGGAALRHALELPDVRSVTSIGRKVLGVSHPKLKERINTDFSNWSALAADLADQDAAVFCMGAYTGAVSDDELRKVTVEYTVAFARALHERSPFAAFSFLSGNGADRTEQSRVPFARYKGMAENALLAAGFPRVYVFRPAYIYPVQARREPNFGYRVLRAIYPVFRIVLPNQVIESDKLGAEMVDIAIRTSPPERLILENRDIRAFAGSTLSKTRIGGGERE